MTKCINSEARCTCRAVVLIIKPIDLDVVIAMSSSSWLVKMSELSCNGKSVTP